MAIRIEKLIEHLREYAKLDESNGITGMLLEQAADALEQQMHDLADLHRLGSDHE